MLTSAFLGLFVAVAAAMPNNDLLKRQGCNRDNCLRALMSTNSLGLSTRGLQDCSSYLIQTIAPCASTTTTTVTTTSVGASVATTTVTVASTSLGTTTTRVTQNITNTRLDTITQTATSTVFANATATVFVTASAPAKREVRKGHAQALFPRDAVCNATSSSATIPAYYSLCSGVVRFTSACSCIGVTAGSTTLTAPPTSTVTVTSTAASNAVSTKTVTTTAVSGALNTVTLISSSVVVVSTQTTTTTTVTVTSTLTQTQTQTAMASSVVSLTGPSCNDVTGSTSGGCSSGCYCDERAGYSGIGVCDAAVYCGLDCNTDADCASGSVCAGGSFVLSSCFSKTCVSYSGCSSTYSPQKRSIFDRGVAARGLVLGEGAMGGVKA